MALVIRAAGRHPPPRLRYSTTLRSSALTLAVLCTGLVNANPAGAALRKAHRAPLELNAFGPTRPLSNKAWLVCGP